MTRRATLALLAGIAGLLAATIATAAWQRRATVRDEDGAGPADRAWARVTLEGDGAVAFSRDGEPARALGNLIAGNEETRREALETLRAVLVPAVAAGTAPGALSPRAALGMSIDASVPWDRVLWVLELVSAPPAGPTHVRLALLGDPRPPVLQPLEYGKGLALVFVGQETVPVLLVQLGVDPDDIDGVEPPQSRVSMSVTQEPIEEAISSPREEASTPRHWSTGRCTEVDVRKMAAGIRAQAPNLEAAVLDVQRPLRHRMKSGDVMTVLRVLHDEGITPVWILHRAMTLPGER